MLPNLKWGVDQFSCPPNYHGSLFHVGVSNLFSGLGRPFEGVEREQNEDGTKRSPRTIGMGWGLSKTNRPS